MDKIIFISAIVLAVLIGCKQDARKAPKPLNDYLLNATKVPTKFEPGNISTLGIEYNSSLSQIHNEFYFSKAAPDFSFRNIMVSRFENDHYETPQRLKIGGVVYNASDVQITNDGDYLFFKMRGNVPNDVTRIDGNIWRSKRVGDQWAKPEILPMEVNSTLSEYYPMLTNNRNLYFSRENDSTSYDIYVSKFTNNKYQIAERLPDYINTGLLESDAYIAPDESYMIFVRMYSDDGLGVSDLYISFNQNGVWTKPKNMVSLNSKGVDGSPFVTHDGKYLFFTSTRESDAPEVFDGHLDIYIAKFNISDWK